MTIYNLTFLSVQCTQAKMIGKAAIQLHKRETESLLDCFLNPHRSWKWPRRLSDKCADESHLEKDRAGFTFGSECAIYCNDTAHVSTWHIIPSKGKSLKGWSTQQIWDWGQTKHIYLFTVTEIALISIWNIILRSVLLSNRGFYLFIPQRPSEIVAVTPGSTLSLLVIPAQLHGSASGWTLFTGISVFQKWCMW